MDLRDLFTGALSWRRFGVILRGLPVESAYKTEVRNTIDLATLPPPEPGVHGPWPQTDMLLASIYDRLGDLVVVQGGYEKPPQRFPRPGVDNVRAISDEALAYLEYKREHRGADPPPEWKPALA